MIKYGLYDLTIDMDESGLPLDHKSQKVLAQKGAKKVHCRTSGNKALITILAVQTFESRVD